MSREKLKKNERSLYIVHYGRCVKVEKTEMRLLIEAGNILDSV